MNKKFSTLVAVLLAAGVFSTVDAKVVTLTKGLTPAAESSFAIGTALTDEAVALTAGLKDGTGTPAEAATQTAVTATDWATATKWKLVAIQGEEGDFKYNLALLNGEGNDVVAYLKGDATLSLDAADAVALKIAEGKLVKDAGSDATLTVGEGAAPSFGNGTALVYFTGSESDAAKGIVLVADAVGQVIALTTGSVNDAIDAESTYALIAEYTAEVPAVYELKQGSSAEITDATKDIWTVNAVEGGFTLSIKADEEDYNGWFVAEDGGALVLAEDAKDAVVFTSYTAGGELHTDTKELSLADGAVKLITADKSDETTDGVVEIAFWQTEAAAGEQPILPGVVGVEIAADGKTVNVTADTKAIGTPTYLQVAGKYVMIKGKVVVETEVAPTTNTAEAYSWTLKDGKYTSLALSNAKEKVCQLTVKPMVSKAAATASWAVTESGSEFSFVFSGPTPTLMSGTDTYGEVVNTLSAITNPAKENLSGQKLVSSINKDTYYLLSANGTGSVAYDGTILEVIAGASSSDNALWKVTETSISSTGACSYQFKNKAGHTLNLDGELFTVQNDGKYNNGFVLLNKGNKPVHSKDGVPTTDAGMGIAVATWGLYEAPAQAYTAEELNSIEGGGFSLTIDVAKDKNATIKGAEAFAGKLTAVSMLNGVYQLKTAEGKYVVLLKNFVQEELNQTWGTESSDLNGKGQYTRGYKFGLVTEEELFRPGVQAYGSWFSISHDSGSDSKDLIVEVSLSSRGWESDNPTSRGRLYIAEVEGEYLLTTTTGKADSDVYPYVVAGSSKTAKIKDLVKGGRFVNIHYANTKKVTGANGNLDRFGKVLTVGLNSNGNMGMGYATLNTEVLAGSPETQWAISGADGKIVFTNREQPTVKSGVVNLYTTDTPDVYSVEYVFKVTDASGKEVSYRDTIRLSYVKDINKYDGFMVAKDNQLRNERYHLSALNQVGNVTQQMYWAENQGTHKIGMDGNVDNAGEWNLSIDKKDWTVDGKTVKDAVIDTVLVISNVSIIKNDQVTSVPDTLAILPYLFQNAANSEYVKYNDESLEAGDFYICDKNKVEANATRFALKMRPDSTYHFVTLDMDKKNSDNTVAPYGNPFSNKIYAGSSTNLLNNVANYSVKGNDLMKVQVLNVPEYRKVSMGDTIRIYREENDSQVVYEKRDASVLVEGQAPSFLNIDNVNQFKNINPAIFVDTAYVNREGGENTRYQYLLAVNAAEVTDAVCPLNPEHNTQAWRDEHNNGKPCPDAVKSHYLKGRFLINLMDTANVYEAKHLHSNNPYIDKNEAGEVRAKLAFVDGYHLNDTLYIQRNNGEYVKLELGTPDFNIAKFAFHYVDYAAGTFKIQTQRKNWKDGDLDVKDVVSNTGYLKWINGTVVVEEGKDAGDIFNLNEDETRNPVANEGITASEVSVVATTGAVIIKGAEGKTVTITNVLGQTVANTVISSDNATISAPAGVVVVAVEGEAAVKAIVK
ncbi:DUF6383 domain-containing protein [Parabacteroides sp. GYB001]|uniref:DUF6383 domain-containing protein n=1 Tax=Parabacteroides leei TaxID=2939491 RepID=UPI00201828FE|nr:DUF6383 domain-containing protein [Parabacteroides leei]MCL3851619.1 DUF6383 domain-containing protein [Parabacteroides leei]